MKAVSQRGVAVCWDGRVVPCCRDFDARYVLGDPNHSTLLEVWNGVNMVKLRHLDEWIERRRENARTYD